MLFLITGGWECDCQNGFYGDYCEIDGCIATPCYNLGTCVRLPGAIECSCSDGYRGEFCEIDCCTEITCHNSGSCMRIPGSAQCSCADGYRGNNCEIDCCTEITCQNQGSCVRVPGAAQCSCRDGYRGQYCQIDICTEITCNHYGTCNRIPGGANCDCVSGYTGSECSTDSGPVFTGSTLATTNGLNDGSWGTWDTCPTGTLATGFQLKTDDNDGFMVEDSGVNVVQLFCSWPENWADDVASITSSISNHAGTWESSYYCPTDYFIVSFRALIVQDRGLQDDLGVVNIEFQCRGSGLYGTSYVQQSGIGVTESGNTWGDWPSSCPQGSAVCSIQTRVEEPGLGDQKGVTDLNLRCCEH